MVYILVSEKYHGIKSDSIIYSGLAKYRGIPSGGTDFSISFYYGTICFIPSSQISVILHKSLCVDEISSRLLA